MRLRVKVGPAETSRSSRHTDEMNSLSSKNSLPPSLHPFNDSSSFLAVECLFTRPSSIIYSTYTITKLFILLPSCIFILCHGLRRWMKICSSSSSKPMSHSDYFTYHLVAIEMIGLTGCVLSTWGMFRWRAVLYLGYDLMYFAWFGQTYMHMLTCVERYLAVVHPLAFRRLRSKRGLGVRNMAAAFVWLLSGLPFLLMPVVNIVWITLGMVVSAFSTVSFCSLWVLCVLIRPGPGEGARIDQSKKRAIYIILVVFKVLVVKFACTTLWTVLLISGSDDCVLITSECLFNLPGSLLVPQLFLYRKGKKIRRRKRKINQNTDKF